MWKLFFLRKRALPELQQRIKVFSVLLIQEHCYLMKFLRCSFFAGKALRALQEKSVTPIGSNEDVAVDVRVLAT